MKGGLLTRRDFFKDGRYNTDILQEHFQHGGLIEKETVITIIDEAKMLLIKEPNMVEVEENALIFGDIHGNYFNFLNILNDAQWVNLSHVKVFLGDYVDRGKYSTETMITLLCLKINSPEGVILLRGNHESAAMTHIFGFERECTWKYDSGVYNKFIELFRTLPLCVYLSLPLGNFFLCHGGLSPSLHSVNQIKLIDRFREIPEIGVFSDMLWSDPLMYETYDEKYENGEINDDWFDVTYLHNDSRDCSYFYGYEAIVTFLENNDLRALIRAHECVDGVQQYDFESDDHIPIMFTVFSSAGYNGTNRGGSIFMGDDGMKVKLYGYTDPVFKDPFYFDTFNYSLQAFFDQFQGICGQMMLYMFDVQEEDKEEDITKTLEQLDSSLSNTLHPFTIESFEKDKETKESVNDTSENKVIIEKKYIPDKCEQKVEQKVKLPEPKFVKKSEETPLQNQIEALQKRQNNRKVVVTNSCVNAPLINTNKNIQPSSRIDMVNKTSSLASSQENDISSLPSTNIILGNTERKLFMSLTGFEKKKSGFKNRLNKFYESAPPTLAQLREYWNKSLKESQSSKETPMDSSKNSLNSSESDLISKHLVFNFDN
ncbi:serine/threonine protein phosphatase 2B catalytic subunit gamma isoform, putative [Entamoeba invadens IP1]|uniref:serine/threonine protein phosphatase 2B catalytic subunit gamma isoform, putative n=1 Tax=Entamoeba invadens IP1 TaxID=370355 RepID=UPI0002C3F06B|nr:serine/threonine protein phosphatase 2B catalytic subunit gamma isoform, putative [Entamoeba invadens IP1]ELP93067.1 serine/threonine protein phosphatase 2B catalytic subunit gamma isoform, putative [Entamoeba invadens IP1]|eukprot:XP_004259838.1 serine/threonine protein phosphatase 2B catalytic subunit gamma isoform, putative [Entamoeba invadens IP1]